MALQSSSAPTSVLHLEGLNCPLPLLKTKLALKQTQLDEIVEVWATDAGSYQDFPIYFATTKHTLLECKVLKTGYYFKIKSAGGY